MKKMIISLVLASIFSLVLVGCGKDAVAESTPETKVEEEQTVIAESTEESSEAAKLSKIQTDVSSHIGEDISEETIVEDSEEPIVDSSEEDSEYADFDYDDSSTVDYLAFCNGDIFELDDYCVALGYDVTLSDPVVDGVSYYTINSCGRDYSIMNYGFTLQISYVDFAEDQIHTAGISRFDYKDPEDMVVRAANLDSTDVSQKWVEEIATVLKLIATSEVDLTQLPVSVEYYYLLEEGRWQYQPDKVLMWETENKVIDTMINH